MNMGCQMEREEALQEFRASLKESTKDIMSSVREQMESQHTELSRHTIEARELASKGIEASQKNERLIADALGTISKNGVILHDIKSQMDIRLTRIETNVDNIKEDVQRLETNQWSMHQDSPVIQQKPNGIVIDVKFLTGVVVACSALGGMAYGFFGGAL
jgi:hypothetical protein